MGLGKLGKGVLWITLNSIAAIPLLALNITIPDQFPGGKGFGGGPTGQGLEDNATEPGTVASQEWDYEAFFLQGNKLGIIAGFDMKSGVAGSYQAPQGDIFIRVGSMVDAKFVSGAPDAVAYDYVIHFPQVPPPPGKPFADTDYWTSGFIQYAVYRAADVTLIPTGNGGIENGLPLLKDWLWQAEPISGRTPIYSTADTGVPMGLYYDNKTSTEVASLTGVSGLLGATHDVLAGIVLDWGKLSISGSDVYFYTTMGCGNDLLEGKTYVPDGGLTVAMLGLGLASLGVVSRRRR